MSRLTRPKSAQPSALKLQTLLDPQAAALQTVPLERVHLLPGFNPRFQGLTSEEQAALLTPEALEGLVASMQEVIPETGVPRGVIQPLLVRPLDAQTYGVIAGERRYRAAQLAGLTHVPVVIRAVTEREALALAIIENAQRQDTDQITQALAGFRLMSTVSGLSEDDLVKHLGALRRGQAEDTYQLETLLQRTYGTGVSTWSQQRAKVLALLPEERRAVQRGKLSAKSAFALLKLKDRLEERENLLQEMLQQETSPSAEEVLKEVSRRLAEGRVLAPSPQTRLKALLPKLKRLDPQRSEEVDALLQRLERLLS